MLEQVLMKFDVVLQHAFTMYQGDVNLPAFMDYDNYQKALVNTLEIHRAGGLDNMYQRIIKGVA